MAGSTGMSGYRGQTTFTVEKVDKKVGKYVCHGTKRAVNHRERRMTTLDYTNAACLQLRGAVDLPRLPVDLPVDVIWSACSIVSVLTTCTCVCQLTSPADVIWSA